jgi:hypothetical protein
MFAIGSGVSLLEVTPTLGTWPSTCWGLSWKMEMTVFIPGLLVQGRLSFNIFGKFYRRGSDTRCQGAASGLILRREWFWNGLFKT